MPGKQEQRDFDFAVVATGMYGWPPHLPLARDHQKFKGASMPEHSPYHTTQMPGGPLNEPLD